jgi:uncharacterized membrane protein YkgB
MIYITIFFQLFLGIAMYDVWLFRYRTPGIFRGGDSTTMEEEFKVYGLSDSFRNLVRVLKLSAGTLILAGVWIDWAALIGGAMLVVLMAGAVSMHIKVKDPLYKAIPSFSFLLMSIWVVWIYRFLVFT